MSRFGFRTTRPEDAQAICELYAAVRGVRRDPHIFVRTWFEGPYGPALSWVIEERESGRVVGHHGLMPVPFVAGQELILAGRTENSMVHPKYRRAVPYLSYEAKALETARQRFRFLFTAASDGAHGKVRERLGYRVLGPWAVVVCFATPGWYVKRLTKGHLALRAPWLVTARRNGWSFEPTTPERVEALWANRPDARNLVVSRAADYLRFRLFDNPLRDFTCWEIQRDRRPLGFIAWTTESASIGIRVRIEDFFSVEKEVDVFAAAMRFLRRMHAGDEARGDFRFWRTGHRWERLLVGQAPWPWGRPMHDSLIHVYSTEDLDFSALEATALVGEGG